MRLVVARQSAMPKEQRCQKCGEPKRPGMKCLPCRRASYDPAKGRAASRAWYEANKDKVKAYGAVHRQEIRERSKAWDAAHPEEAKARHHASYLANRERVRARSKARRMAKPEHYRAYSKKWRDAHPEQARALWRGAAIRHHGLTLAQYDAILAVQGGVCRICETATPGGHGTWHIDHDHACCPTKDRSCGRCVRGLLCNACNLGLGKFRDDPDTLRRAIAYLEASRRPRAVAG